MASIKNLPKHEQPREKLIEKGPQNLRDSELMAILLRVGVEGRARLAEARRAKAGRYDGVEAR